MNDSSMYNRTMRDEEKVEGNERYRLFDWPQFFVLSDVLSLEKMSREYTQIGTEV